MPAGLNCPVIQLVKREPIRSTMFTSALWILVAIILYGAIHSLLAALRLKALARHWVGHQADRWYRLIFNVFAILSLLPVLALPAMLPDETLYKITPPLLYLTLVIQGLAALMILATFLQIDALSFVGLRQLLYGPAKHMPEQLAVTGFYRWMRHPLYTGSMVLLWLTPVMTFNLAVLYLGFTAYFIVGAVFEERKLLQQYGAAYAQYQKDTPMFFPTFQALRRKSSIVRQSRVDDIPHE